MAISSRPVRAASRRAEKHKAAPIAAGEPETELSESDMDEWIASLESTFTEIASMVERVGEFKDVVEAVRKQSSEVAKLSDGVNEYIAMVDETKAYMDTQSKALKEALALAKEILTLMEARTRSVSWDTDGDELLPLPDIPPELQQQVNVNAVQSLPATASDPAAHRKRQCEEEEEEDESDGESSRVGGDSVQKRARTEPGWTGDAQPEASSSRVQLPPLAHPDLAAGTPASVTETVKSDPGALGPDAALE